MSLYNPKYYYKVTKMSDFISISLSGEVFSTVTKCAFDSLDVVKGSSSPVVANDLDGQKDVRTVVQMIQDIVTLNNDCGRYHVGKNNCEHIATTIRYGEAVCLQVCVFI